VAEHIETALAKPRLSADAHLPDQLPRSSSQRVSWRPQLANNGDAERVNAKLGHYFRQWMDEDDDVFLIGEDVLDPYGGAFKVAKGLSSAHPGRVYTTPISEAGITGLGVGLAIAGRRPLVEIMFGDFMTLTFDQLVNNASKFYQMFNRQISCPIVVRTPMGGRRGYGR
jgi:2-oxoisovalerate dehydrogenase E1 component